MKINIKYFVPFLFVLLLTLQGCDKFLEQEPDNRTEINSVAKVAQLVSTAYPTRDYLLFTETASDNVEDKGVGVGSVADISSRPYYWQDIESNVANTPGIFWLGCYQAIAAANQALEAIDTQNLGSGVLPYKGEALVARAYAHFMLVTLFAKTYQKGTANDSPGIPYITEPETVVIKQYDRGTVQSTYDKIEKDLTEGLALLSSNVYSTAPKYHFTPASAHAFAARFYLFKQEWQKVIDHVTAIQPTGDFVPMLRPVNSTLRQYTTDELLYAYTRADLNANLLLVSQYAGYTSATGTARYGYGIGLSRMFNHTSNYSGKSLGNLIVSYSSNTHFFSAKYTIHTLSNVGYIMMPLFTVDEALMNRAEAYTQLNQLDNAIKDVKDFLSVRILGYNESTDAPTVAKAKTFYNITDDKEAVIKLILQHKKAEFLQEGIRWFDILRHRLTVRHNVFDARGEESFIYLGPDDNRRLFQIPQEAVLSGVAQNPR